MKNIHTNNTRLFPRIYNMFMYMRTCVHVLTAISLYVFVIERKCPAPTSADEFGQNGACYATYLCVVSDGVVVVSFLSLADHSDLNASQPVQKSKV
jgi:hypothetical protein